MGIGVTMTFGSGVRHSLCWVSGMVGLVWASHTMFIGWFGAGTKTFELGVGRIIDGLRSVVGFEG